MRKITDGSHAFIPLNLEGIKKRKLHLCGDPLWFAFAKLMLLCFLALSLFVPAANAVEEKPLKVVASFSILGDMVQRVGGDAVQLWVLAGPDADLHTIQPSPKDVKALSEADVIVINGLGLDHWMQSLIDASQTHAKLLVASAGVKPRYMDKENKVVDPHAWQDLRYGRLYVRNIANGLISSAPEFGRAISERAAKYVDDIKKMDAFVREELVPIPKEKRKIITNHDAFGYFADAYDVTFISPLGVSTEAEPSAMVVSKLIEQIKAEKVHTVFIENVTDPRLMQQISEESDAEVGGTLYSDSLSAPEGPAPTYLDMFRNNMPKMKEAMEKSGS